MRPGLLQVPCGLASELGGGGAASSSGGTAQQDGQQSYCCAAPAPLQLCAPYPLLPAAPLLALTGRDPLIDVALALEKAARADEYFVKRKLYPNVDFFSGGCMRSCCCCRWLAGGAEGCALADRVSKLWACLGLPQCLSKAPILHSN